MIWDCPANVVIEGLEHDADLVARAHRERRHYPSVWLRGLLPAYEVPRPHIADEVYYNEHLLPTGAFTSSVAGTAAWLV